MRAASLGCVTWPVYVVGDRPAAGLTFTVQRHQLESVKILPPPRREHSAEDHERS